MLLVMVMEVDGRGRRCWTHILWCLGRRVALLKTEASRTAIGRQTGHPVMMVVHGRAVGRCGHGSRSRRRSSSGCSGRCCRRVGRPIAGRRRSGRTEIALTNNGRRRRDHYSAAIGAVIIGAVAAGRQVTAGTAVGVVVVLLDNRRRPVVRTARMQTAVIGLVLTGQLTQSRRTVVRLLMLLLLLLLRLLLLRKEGLLLLLKIVGRGTGVGQRQMGGGSCGRRRHRRRIDSVLEETVIRFEGLAFAPEASRPAPETALFKHELGGRIDGPVVTFARPPQAFWQFDETLVEREIVTHRVLPALIGSPEEWEALLEELVDFAQRQPLAGRALDGHDDQCDVGIRRFLLSPDSRGRRCRR